MTSLVSLGAEDPQARDQRPIESSGLIGSPGGRQKKQHRLSRSSEFQRVYRQGKSKANRHFVLYTFQSGGASARVGLSVGRKVGNAVVRNRVKRHLREALVGFESELADGLDYVVIARADSAELVERAGTSGVSESLRELIAPQASGAGPVTTPGGDRATEATVAEEISAEESAKTPQQ